MTAPARRLRPRRTDKETEGEGRHWPLARIFGAVAAAAALLAAIGVVIGTLSLVRLNTARSVLLDQIGPAVRTGQLLGTALVDQETGVRGFELSGREESLGPFLTGVAAERSTVATLRGLSGEVPELAADVDALEGALGAWRSGYADRVVAAVRAGAPAGTVAADDGRVLFDRVRADSAAMQDHLEHRRVAARSALDTAAAFVSGVGVAIAVVTVLFFIAAAVVLRLAVLRPISLLAAKVRGVVSDDVAQSVSGSGPREIVGLGSDVESMRAHIVRELDEVQQVNKRLDEQARDLERSNRDLEQFAYVASHDLQEPLRKVSSFCQLLQRRYGGTLDERADQYIEFAVDGAHRMQRLINDLLAFSRVGRTTTGFTELPLAVPVGRAVEQQEQACAAVDGEVVVEELPTVTGDRALLEQLFANLIGNALKFHRDGVAPVVRITAAPAADPEGGWEIAVADNGIGIEPQYADKVFVIFQRLHARDVYSGTGIGLSLAKKIVEFHGGRIWVDVDPDRAPGTTIRFVLPGVAARTSAPAAAAIEEETVV